jgi:hypothetical protein
MHKLWHFWLVGILSGLFSGLIMLVLYFSVNYLANNYFSVYYIFIYFFPLLSLWTACYVLRHFFGLGVLRFKHAFRLSLLTSFISAIVFSIGMYFVFTYLNQPSTGARSTLIESEYQLGRQGLSFEEIKDKKEQLQLFLSPFSIAFMYFLLNIVLTPFFALIIAIFARRKNRFIE